MVARYFKPVLTLRWKLMLTAAVAIFLAVAVVTVITVVQGSIVDQRLVEAADLRPALELEAASLAAGASSIIAGGTRGAGEWLSSRSHFCDLGVVTDVTSSEGTQQQVLVALSMLTVVGADGRVLASLPEGDLSTNRRLDDVAPAFTREIIRQAGAGTGPAAFATRQPGGNTFVAAPIRDAAGGVAGMIYLEAETGPLTSQVLAGRVSRMLVQMVPRATPFAIVVALILGALSTRGLVRRLRRLGSASKAWARGDFSQRVEDPSADELGDLGRGLDDMALQVSTLLDAREELGALEERNHLARELHDTVKQKVFSVSMMLGSIELLLESDPKQARACLADARQVAQEAGRELVGLIDQLRPNPEQRSGLASSLRRCVGSWASIQGVPAEVLVTGKCVLSGEVEHNLLRVTQEALANVARHGQARRVGVELVAQPLEGKSGWQRVCLSIRDDGVGFDVARSDGRGFGLESMMSRMERLGGELRVESRIGEGTTIAAAWTGRSDEGGGEHGQAA